MFLIVFMCFFLSLVAHNPLQPVRISADEEIFCTEFKTPALPPATLKAGAQPAMTASAASRPGSTGPPLRTTRAMIPCSMMLPSNGNCQRSFPAH